MTISLSSFQMSPARIGEESEDVYRLSFQRLQVP